MFPQRLELLVGKLSHVGIRFRLQQGLRPLDRVQNFLVLPELLHYGAQLAVGFGMLLVGGLVAYDRRIRQHGVQIFELLLQGVEFVHHG